jgi:hypothetical protein
MSEIVTYYLRIVENPTAPKNYRDLANYYRSRGMVAEAEGFESLLKLRFTDEANADGPHPDTQQQQHP